MVVAVLLVSSTEVAVMVALPAVAGAVHTPAAVIEPALAAQVTVPVAPPVTVAEKVALLPTETVDEAGLREVTATVWGVRVKVLVAKLPAVLATSRVKVLGAVMTPLANPEPVVTAPTDWSTLPVPALKTGVTVVLPP